MSERREATRKRVYLGGRIVHRYIRSDTNCLLRNLSPTGARIVVGATIPLPDRFDIVIDHCGTTRSAEAIWRSGDAMGIRFVTDAPERERLHTVGGERERSRTELARLRARITEIELQTRPPEWALH